MAPAPSPAQPHPTMTRTSDTPAEVADPRRRGAAGAAIVHLHALARATAAVAAELFRDSCRGSRPPGRVSTSRRRRPERDRPGSLAAPWPASPSCARSPGCDDFGPLPHAEPLQTFKYEWERLSGGQPRLHLQNPSRHRVHPRAARSRAAARASSSSVRRRPLYNWPLVDRKLRTGGGRVRAADLRRPVVIVSDAGTCCTCALPPPSCSATTRMVGAGGRLPQMGWLRWPRCARCTSAGPRTALLAKAAGVEHAEQVAKIRRSWAIGAGDSRRRRGPTALALKGFRHVNF